MSRTVAAGLAMLLGAVLLSVASCLSEEERDDRPCRRACCTQKCSCGENCRCDEPCCCPCGQCVTRE